MVSGRLNGSEKKMLGGQVVRIRLSPTDCISLVDIADKIGIPKAQYISFAQICKLAISSTLRSLRENGVIPTRSGFEYTEVMSRFVEFADDARAKKLDTTRLIEELGPKVAPAPLVPKSLAVREAEQRKAELIARRDNGIEWQEDEVQEFMRIQDYLAGSREDWRG